VLRFLQFILLGIVFSIASVLEAQVYVSPYGNDANDGSLMQPKASLSSALRQVREWRRLKTSQSLQPIHIILQDGVYPLSEPIFVRPEDSGTPESPTIIESAANASVVLSGGVEVNGWQPIKEKVEGLPTNSLGNIWAADIPASFFNLPPIRQLWIDGEKGSPARWPNKGEMERILSWNKKDETCQIPAIPFDIKKMQGMEMFIHQWWEIAILRIQKFSTRGDSTQLYFQQPESRIQSEHPWPAPWISKETGNSAFYLCNAIEFLDQPGEWFADKTQQRIYYWPRHNENLRQATVLVPLLENLVSIIGDLDNPVSNIHFKSISFEHSAWNRPSLQGHVPHQTGMPMTDAYKLRPAGTKEKASLENQAWITRPVAAVNVSFARNTSFEACQFQHLASTGIDYHKGVKNNIIQGNVFKDIGGNAVLAGVFSDNGFEVHLPYHPKDERVVTDSISIINNLITNATNEDWGTVGIGLGYTRNSLVAHNEIEDVNYSGISMGWGWSPLPNVMHNNKIVANKIHHFGKQNYDCAGIYTLSAQPGSLISDNVIDSICKAPYAHLPSHWYYLYTDEGSSQITVKDNWTASKKYLQNNNGPGNIWENNGPQVDGRIKQNAGLQPDWKHLLQYKNPNLHLLSVNSEHEELVELVAPNQRLNLSKLKAFLIMQGLDPNCIYKWKNRYVIFDKVQDLSVFESRLKKEFPELIVRPYYDMYYQFDRSRCKDNLRSMEWEHILLTANLVADKHKQKEYLAYHANQFAEWPEVAKGFCEAGFQRLMMFRNGRQLMLVISIPKGKTLDELNPKTTANNPRMIEWNRIMAQYQEGIEGTKKGEVWAFLKKL